jgi:hypothetical protein
MKWIGRVATKSPRAIQISSISLLPHRRPGGQRHNPTASDNEFDRFGTKGNDLAPFVLR